MGLKFSVLEERNRRQIQIYSQPEKVNAILLNVKFLLNMALVGSCMFLANSNVLMVPTMNPKDVGGFGSPFFLYLYCRSYGVCVCKTHDTLLSNHLNQQ